MIKSAPRRAEKERVSTGRKPLSRSLRMYQRIAVAFVVLTFLLLISVLYLSVSRATIRVVAEPKRIAVSETLEVVAEPKEDGQIAGVVAEKTLEKEKIFTLPQEGAKEIEAKAQGYVTLINETTKDQPLVATTRVLSQEGVLFRLVKPTTVPAGGQVEVLVAADQPGKKGEIGASRFTIPGLGDALQAKIYAVSVNPMTGGVQYVRPLTDKDVADAVTVLTGEITESAKMELSAGVDTATYTAQVFFVDPLSQSTNIPVGTETGQFTLKMKVDVTAVYYQEAPVTTYMQTLLASRVTDGFRLVRVDLPGMEVVVANADSSKGTAELNVDLTGEALLSEDAQSLEKERFLGRAPHEVVTLLRATDTVKEASVSFTPFWLKRVPTLQDHIRILIEEPKK